MSRHKSEQRSVRSELSRSQDRGYSDGTHNRSERRRRLALAKTEEATSRGEWRAEQSPERVSCQISVDLTFLLDLGQ